MAKQSLASAYVQIIPSADGISGKLAEVMGGEAASAGKISGKSLGSALVGSLTKVVAAAGIGKMLQSTFTGGTAFESAMAKVGTIADTAKVPLKSLSSQVLQVSGDMRIGANEIAEAAYQAISAGQDTGNAVAFAGQASMLAKAGFTSSASAVDILTTALNAYGKGADEAGHVSDVLLTTQNLGKTSVDELAGSMGRVIPLAAAYNVSLENLSSGLAIMTANGIATAEASTYTKSMLNELGDTGSAVGKILQQQTGKSFAELNADGKSLGDVLQVLYGSVGGNATKFAGLWSSVEAGTGALSLASSGADKFNGVLQQMQADSGATQTAYDTMTDTMAYKLDGVKTNAQNLGTALFDAVSGRLGEGVALAGGYLQTLSESVQQNGIAGLAEGLAAVFTDLATNVGPQLLQTGIDLLGKLGEGLVTGIPQLLAQALPVAASLASGLRENAGQLVDAGIHFESGNRTDERSADDNRVSAGHCVGHCGHHQRQRTEAADCGCAADHHAGTGTYPGDTDIGGKHPANPDGGCQCDYSLQLAESGREHHQDSGRRHQGDEGRADFRLQVCAGRRNQLYKEPTRQVHRVGKRYDYGPCQGHHGVCGGCCGRCEECGVHYCNLYSLFPPRRGAAAAV